MLRCPTGSVVYGEYCMRTLYMCVCVCVSYIHKSSTYVLTACWCWWFFRSSISSVFRRCRLFGVVLYYISNLIDRFCYLRASCDIILNVIFWQKFEEKWNELTNGLNIIICYISGEINFKWDSVDDLRIWRKYVRVYVCSRLCYLKAFLICSLNFSTARIRNSLGFQWCLKTWHFNFVGFFWLLYSLVLLFKMCGRLKLVLRFNIEYVDI